MFKKFLYDVGVGTSAILASGAVLWGVNEYVYPLWRRRTMNRAIADATQRPGPPDIQAGINGAIVKPRTP